MKGNALLTELLNYLLAEINIRDNIRYFLKRVHVCIKKFFKLIKILDKILKTENVN